jgi:hypothetical protein
MRMYLCNIRCNGFDFSLLRGPVREAGQNVFGMESFQSSNYGQGGEKIDERECQQDDKGCTNFWIGLRRVFPLLGLRGQPWRRVSV